jgi:hypothetical protein
MLDKTQGPGPLRRAVSTARKASLHEKRSFQTTAYIPFDRKKPITRRGLFKPPLHLWMGHVGK